MASQLIREWTGIQQFPGATQTKLLELLGKLKQENVNTLTILVMGKGGVGKSSTVNSLIGERVVAVSAFQSEGQRPVMVSRSRAGFTLNIIDTPGLIEGGYVNDQALEIIKRFLLNKTIDVLLYVDRLDAYRVDNLDRQVIRAITDSFGKEIWRRGVVVLTHAQLSPPDGINYDNFFSRRSDALVKVIRLGARIRKQEFQDSALPIVLVENSGRCNTNESGEKVLPNGTTWISNLFGTITNVVSNGSKAIFVDKKLIEGPNPNEKYKLFIPLILAFQYLFVVKRIERAIKVDISKANKPLWELRDMGLLKGKLTYSYFRREKWEWGAREDWRFDDMRKQYGKHWWWVSFFAVYASQQIFLMGITLPVYAVHSVEKPWNIYDSVATTICMFGIIFAYFADTQLHEFVSSNEKRKELGVPKLLTLEKGLWRYSRHPNYVGEQLWWWGLVMYGWNVGYGWTFIGSLVNSLCLAYVTILVEQRILKQADRVEAYNLYQKTTSVWIPWFKFSPRGAKDKNS
ncbi:hypothetical protein GIB67_033235 [Kingdonia uniflora]|uniref:AIG1-type G domain-containing protein n=1 Tax=Kingdonia uniflora TaxID=39325 RepID=A0A7J7MPF1_9MAGN|nr:hypothetical protein GIB67_033235 [Kingdonia uniflora]